jgi:hypothetical protein
MALIAILLIVFGCSRASFWGVLSHLTPRGVGLGKFSEELRVDQGKVFPNHANFFTFAIRVILQEDASSLFTTLVHAK